MPTINLSNPASGTWSVVGASTLTTRKYLAGAGTENAALAIGGDSYLTKTEKFDGSAWSATGNLNFNRKTFAATGLQTAALAFGGAYSAVTEKFNGSTWTTSGNLIGTIVDLAGTGTQDAALAFGGGSGQKGTQKFNGSTWSMTGDMITAKYELAGAGTQNAGLAFGGTDSFAQRSLTTEKFNGSTWTASGNLSVARTALGGSGLQTAALAIGGLVPSYSALTEKFNGSTWTTTTSMSGGRSYFGNAKNAQSAALVFGGFNGISDLATTQKFIDGGNVSPLQITEGVLANSTIGTLSAAEAGMSYSLVAGTGDTDNASFSISNNNLNTSLSSFDYETKPSYSVRIQASNGTTTYQNVVTIEVLNNAADDPVTIKLANPNILNATLGTIVTSENMLALRFGHGGAGTSNAALAFGGGAGGTPYGTSEKFNGSTWSASQNMANGHISMHLGGCGTQNAALATGGWTGSVTSSVVQKYDGSSWSVSGVSALPSSVYSHANAGTTNAAISFGGYNGSVYSYQTLKFDGSAWSTSGNLIASKSSLSGSGTQNAAISCGGWDGITRLQSTELFNGQVWYAGGNTVGSARQNITGIGTQSAGLIAGGEIAYNTNHSSSIEHFNGSTWSNGVSLTTGRAYAGGAGTQQDALIFGGKTGSNTYSQNTIKYTSGGNVSPIEINEGVITSEILCMFSSPEAGMSYSLVAGTGDTDNASFSILNSKYLKTSLSSFDYESKPSYSVRIQASNGTTTYQNVVTVDVVNNTADDPISIINFSGDYWLTQNSVGLDARIDAAGAGTQNAALAVGGRNQSAKLNNTKKFNGSTWSNSGNISSLTQSMASVGTQSAALAFGGNIGSTTNATYKYDGTSWSANSSWNLRNGRESLGGAGISNAALAIGGQQSFEARNTSETFDGSSWSNVTNSLITARYGLASCGLQNAALAFGGYNGSVLLKTTESFNGSSWSAVSGGDMLTAKMSLAGCGSQGAALAFGGSGYSAVTEKFNGSTWVVSGNLQQKRSKLAGAGTQSAALSFGGTTDGSDYSGATEKFTLGQTISAFQVDENALSVSPALGKLSTLETGMSYSLVAGTGDTDNASFSIKKNNYLSASISNFSKSSYSVRIKATNGATTYENVLPINVVVINQAPTNIILSSNSIAENNAVNAVVGTLSAIDPNVGDTSFTFSITGGADAAKFNISGNQLRASQAFNYESPADANADNVYVVEITAQDAGGLSYAKTFNISVTNDASDDSIAAPNVAIIYIQSIGRYKFNLNTDPRTIPVLMAGSALPTNSVIRHTGNNKKYVKLEGAATAFGEIPVTPPASWNFSEEGISAWAVLQGF